MTSTKFVVPSESIYSVMSPHLNYSHHQQLQQHPPPPPPPNMHVKSSSSSVKPLFPSSSSSIPMLSMMIDRTSFDETDDFNVDQQAKEKAQDACVPAPPMIMKDGKVRRRLRWRPKGMAKRRKGPPPPPPPSPSPSHPSINHTTATSTSIHPVRQRNSYSSSGSVVSQTSRHSKKSLHSFASTETACVNNKSTTGNRRKNSLTSFSLLPTGPRSSPHQLGNIATIGNEGDLIHARIQRNHQSSANGKLIPNSTRTSTIFASADEQSTIGGFTNNNETNKLKGEANKMSMGRNQRGIGLKPPLFQRPGGASMSRNSPHSSTRNNKNNESFGSDTSTSTGKLSDSNTSVDDSIDNGSMRTASLIPVPVLSGDEVESERRVDLRIRKSSSFTTESSEMTNSDRYAVVMKNIVDAAAAVLDDGVEPLSIHELRFDEERQESNPGGIRKLRSNHSDTNSKSTISSSNSNQRVSGLSWSTSIISSDSQKQQDEIRFSMSNITPTHLQQQHITTTSSSSNSNNARCNSSNNNKNVNINPNTASNGDVKSSVQKVRTCPVDVDKGTFLEAEKNLQAIHEMASEHLRQGECTEALEVFEEILRGQLARFGPDHYRVGTALHNIGIVHMRRKDYVRALTVYKEAVRIRKKTLNPFHSDVAASLAQLGVAYMERDKHRKAIGSFREALKIRRICLGNDHPKVAKILNNIGCSLFELNELEVAMVAFEEALDIQRNLLRNPIDGSAVSESSLLSIASTQSNIASIKLYCGHFDEALVDLEEALLIQQCALGDDHPLARRTQESIRWMETSRQTNEASSLPIDLLTQLTGESMTSTIASLPSKSRSAATKVKAKTNQNRRMMLSSNMFDTLLARLDLVCGGWDPSEELDTDNRSYQSGDTASDRSSTE